MRLATWNVNSVTARLPRLLDWLQGAAPDVLCLQELKTTRDAFPADALAGLGYEAAVAAEGRWNGVAVLSRVGLEDVVVELPGAPSWPQDGLLPGPVEARAVAATCGGLRVWSLYVPNGRSPEDPHYGYKLAWLDALRVAVGEQRPDAPPLALCGDFNVAPADDDVWDRSRFEGSTHVTAAERTALARLRDLGLRDVVPVAQKGPHPYTYWDYRAGAFHKDMGMRIDLVYANAAAAGAVGRAVVDREARKGKGASDHAPVVVDLDL